jgi:hypothetical protein
MASLPFVSGAEPMLRQRSARDLAACEPAELTEVTTCNATGLIGQRSLTDR